MRIVEYDFAGNSDTTLAVTRKFLNTASLLVDGPRAREAALLIVIADAILDSLNAQWREADEREAVK